MTLYLPGPWELEFLYTEAGLTHIQRLNCQTFVEGAVGDPLSAFTLERRANVPTSALTLATAWVNLIKPLFAATTNFTVVNLYKYNAGSLSKVFYSTATLGLVGTSGAAYSPTQQLILSFRSQLGNSVKISLLEIATNSQVRQPIDDAPANVQAIADFVSGADSWILARDGSYPIGQLNACYGKNDSIEKKRFR